MVILAPDPDPDPDPDPAPDPQDSAQPAECTPGDDESTAKPVVQPASTDPTAGLVRTDADIHAAVKKYRTQMALAVRTYGHISLWDTSSVTNMSGLFMAWIGRTSTKISVAGTSVVSPTWTISFKNV